MVEEEERAVTTALLALTIAGGCWNLPFPRYVNQSSLFSHSVYSTVYNF
jgi:hypothetical protein